MVAVATERDKETIQIMSDYWSRVRYVVKGQRVAYGEGLQNNVPGM